jgi:hypothetical protein
MAFTAELNVGPAPTSSPSVHAASPESRLASSGNLITPGTAATISPVIHQGTVAQGSDSSPFEVSSSLSFSFLLGGIVLGFILLRHFIHKSRPNPLQRVQ